MKRRANSSQKKHSKQRKQRQTIQRWTRYKIGYTL